MPTPPRILAFAGSLRQASWNHQLIEAAAARAQDIEGAELTVIRLRDYPLPVYDQDIEDAEGLPENAKALKALLLDHQGLLVATPEYNSGITAALKNVIDWTSRVESKDEPSLACYQGKVVGLLSASPGGLGGLRSLFHTRWVFQNIACLVVPQTHALGQAYQAFAEDGTLKDETAQAKVDSVLEAVIAQIG